MRTKNASCQVRLLHSKCSIFLEMSKHHQLPHKCSSSTLCPGKNNLWGIVKSWQPWGSRNNKGVTKHWWHQNTWAKSPHNDQKWTKGRSENASGTFFLCALVCANLCLFCANLQSFCAYFVGTPALFFKKCSICNDKCHRQLKSIAAQSAFKPSRLVFLRSVRSSYAQVHKKHTHRPHLETWGDMEPMRPTGSKKCSSFQKTQIAQTQSN